MPTSPPAPLTGSAQRFAIDQVAVPTTLAQATAMAFEANGGQRNSIGSLIADLASYNDAGSDSADQIRSGALAGSIVLTAGSGDEVGVSIDGGPQLRATRDADGRIATDALELATVPLQLPAFADADPVALELDAAVVQLVPDGSGYSVGLQGFVARPAAILAAGSGIAAMMTNNPQQHTGLFVLFDTNCDGMVTAAEVAASPVLGEMLAPDQLDGLVEFPADDPAQLSLGYSFHVSPCASGSCVDTPIADHCRDRVLDGDETGLDCGGSCAACSAGVACGSDGDCDSRSCTGGTCAAPTCTDGIQDGAEDGVDVGIGCGSSCTGGSQ